MTMQEKPRYDLARAAAAGEFGDDVENGKDVARTLHATVARLTGAGEPFTATTVINDTIAQVAEEFYDEHCGDNPSGNPFWLSVMHNSVTAMYRDLIEQCREAAADRRSA